MGKSTKAESESLKDGAEALSDLSADAMNAVRALSRKFGTRHWSWFKAVVIR